MSKSDLNCSFCGKKKDQTSLLIAGIDAHICDVCIEQANGIIIQENKSQQKSEEKSDLQTLKPQQIKLFLDDYIVGQDFTKKVISNKGYFISKIFMGSTFNEIVALGKKIFKEVKVFKPKSSRKDSKESFIICKILR